MLPPPHCSQYCSWYYRAFFSYFPPSSSSSPPPCIAYPPSFIFLSLFLPLLLLCLFRSLRIAGLLRRAAAEPWDRPWLKLPVNDKVPKCCSSRSNPNLCVSAGAYISSLALALWHQTEAQKQAAILEQLYGASCNGGGVHRKPAGTKTVAPNLHPVDCDDVRFSSSLQICASKIIATYGITTGACQCKVPEASLVSSLKAQF